MQKVIVIVTKNGVKYQIGVDKSVSDVVNEINVNKDGFYQVHANCAIRADEVVSVEQFEFNPEEAILDDEGSNGEEAN